MEQLHQILHQIHLYSFYFLFLYKDACSSSAGWYWELHCRWWHWLPPSPADVTPPPPKSSPSSSPGNFWICGKALSGIVSRRRYDVLQFLHGFHHDCSPISFVTVSLIFRTVKKRPPCLHPALWRPILSDHLTGAFLLSLRVSTARLNGWGQL